MSVSRWHLRPAQPSAGSVSHIPVSISTRLGRACRRSTRWKPCGPPRAGSPIRGDDNLLDCDMLLVRGVMGVAPNDNFGVIQTESGFKGDNDIALLQASVGVEYESDAMVSRIARSRAGLRRFR